MEDMNNLLDTIRAFNQERDWEQFHSPKNLSMALSVEVAEVVEHFQWLDQDQSKSISPSKKEEIKDEIGDILIYLVNLADKLGIDPVQAAVDKIEKNRKNYPVELSRGNAVKYTGI
jgi:NTP pyrophosphatase (non-canonical NTP hydrolase)